MPLISQASIMYEVVSGCQTQYRAKSNCTEEKNTVKLECVTGNVRKVKKEKRVVAVVKALPKGSFVSKKPTNLIKATKS